MSEMEKFFTHANHLLDRLDVLLPQSGKITLENKEAYCWKFSHDTNKLSPVLHVSDIMLDDLLSINDQKEKLVENTLQFLNGFPANNALLWGPRGTGKSSLIKALLNEFKNKGLRLIEILRDDMHKLPEICDLLYDEKEKYILYCDDLSFENNEPGYKSIKVILDGSVKQTPVNVLIYATSNRRHLVPEQMSDNLESGIIDGELHYGDSVEEKLSLSERFGLRVAFHPFNQEDYLLIVEYWLKKLLNNEKISTIEYRQPALQWALQNGSRSGRCALLFSRDWAGKYSLKNI